MNRHYPDPRLKDVQPPLEFVTDFTGTDSEIEAFKRLVNSEEYKNATTFREQVGLIADTVRNDLYHVSIKRIADLFGKNKASVHQQIKKYHRGKRPNGRPRELSKAELNIIKSEIRKYHLNNRYPTYDEIADMIYLRFHKYLLQDTLRNYFQEELSDEFKSCPGIAMDEDRLDASEEKIDDYYNQLDETINGIPTPFIFNLDECGFEDWMDARELRVIVPKDYNKATAPYRVSRSGKLSTALHCISADGTWMSPQIVVKRVTFDSEIYKYVSPYFFQPVHTASGYVNSVSFKYWFDHQFIPHLMAKRMQNNYFGDCVLIMDGLLAHKNVIENIDLALYRIKVIFLPPHSSDQTQPLDLGVFGPTKRYCSNFRKHPDVSNQTNQTIKTIRSLWQASAPDCVISAFRCAGIVPIPQASIDNTLILAKVARSCCESVRHYQASHIDNLIRNGIHLSESQMIVLEERRNGVFPRNYRIKIPNFS